MTYPVWWYLGTRPLRKGKVSLVKEWVQPPLGSEDWIWYHPEPTYERTWRLEGESELEYWRAFRCDKCQVGFHEMVTPTNRIQCWNCGKFLRKPKYLG